MRVDTTGIAASAGAGTGHCAGGGKGSGKGAGRVYRPQFEDCGAAGALERGSSLPLFCRELARADCRAQARLQRKLPDLASGRGARKLAEGQSGSELPHSKARQARR